MLLLVSELVVIEAMFPLVLIRSASMVLAASLPTLPVVRRRLEIVLTATEVARVVMFQCPPVTEPAFSDATVSVLMFSAKSPFDVIVPMLGAEILPAESPTVCAVGAHDATVIDLI